MTDTEREELRALRSDLTALAGRVIEIEAGVRVLAEIIGELRGMIELQAAPPTHH